MKLNDSNYHGLEANQTYFSNSQYKQFLRCENMALAEIEGHYQRPTTKDLLIGSYVDAYVSNELDDFKESHPEIISSRGATKGQLKAEFRSADDMIERFKRDDLFMKYLSGDTQTIMTGEIGGVPFRIKVDILNDEFITDLKTVRDFGAVWSDTEGKRVSFISAWGYDIQGAIYQEIVKQNTGKHLPFFIAAITKEFVPDIKVIQISDELLKERLKEIEYNIGRFSAIKAHLIEPERCEHCDYCKTTKILLEPELFEGEI